MFAYKQAQELAKAFDEENVRYMLIGKSGAIVHGFPDTTQDVDIFVPKAEATGVVKALRRAGFDLKEEHAEEISRGKDFVQIRYGPYDVDLVFAPDGIESFDEAYKRSVIIEGLRCASLDDIISSKRAAWRIKDREVLSRLEQFRDYIRKKQQSSDTSCPTNIPPDK